MELKRYCRPEFALPGLRDLIGHLPEGIVMVEVGSYAGESAAEFLSYDKITHLHAIDPWMAVYEGQEVPPADRSLDTIEAEFDERMKAFAGRVTKHRTTSAEAAGQWADHELDFVYIDADHTYESVRDDLALWLPKVRLGGFIGGHDYECRFPGVIQAVVSAMGVPDATFSENSWLKRLG